MSNVPWRKLFLACAVWLLVIELGSYAYLRSIRNDPYNQITWMLKGMVDHFHPLFNGWGAKASEGDPYYPYTGLFYSGHWDKTTPPVAFHPDGWVLPDRVEPDGTQHYIRPEKPAGVLRLITLGGSTMAGFGQSGPDKSIPAVLESLLRRRHPDKRIEVVNGAFYTFIAAQELSILETKLIAFHPDAILVLDGYNEMVRAYHMPDMPPFWGFPHEQQVRSFQRMQTFRGVLSQLGFLLSNRLYCLALPRAYLYNRKFWHPAPAPGKEKAFDPKPYDRSLDEYLLVQKSLLGVGLGHEIPVVLALQPTLAYEKPASAKEQDILKEWGRTYHGYGDYCRYYFSEAQRRHRALKAGPASHVLDLTGVFKRTPETRYSDACHYNDTGAEEIAKALVPAAEKALRLR